MPQKDLDSSRDYNSSVKMRSPMQPLAASLKKIDELKQVKFAQERAEVFKKNR